MKICTTAPISSTSASTLEARTSVNVNKICTLLMANAEVTRDELVWNRIMANEIRKLFHACFVKIFIISPAFERDK